MTAPAVSPRPLELLAPAADREVAFQAILHGADAVYMGGPSHGARRKAANSIDDIRAVTDFAHRFRARVYVTVNTLVYENELRGVERLCRDLYEAGVDALIVQDMSLLRLDIPPIALHASTQCDTRTPAKARFLQDVGFSQIVLAREPRRPLRQLFGPMRSKLHVDGAFGQPRRMLPDVPSPLHVAQRPRRGGGERPIPALAARLQRLGVTCRNGRGRRIVVQDRGRHRPLPPPARRDNSRRAGPLAPRVGRNFGGIVHTLAAEELQPGLHRLFPRRTPPDVDGVAADAQVDG